MSLVGSSQLAVCAHAQYISGQKQHGSTGAAFKLQCIRNCHAFYFYSVFNGSAFLVDYCCMSAGVKQSSVYTYDRTSATDSSNGSCLWVNWPLHIVTVCLFAH